MKYESRLDIVSFKFFRIHSFFLSGKPSFLDRKTVLERLSHQLLLSVLAHFAMWKETQHLYLTSTVVHLPGHF